MTNTTPPKKTRARNLTALEREERLLAELRATRLKRALAWLDKAKACADLLAEFQGEPLPECGAETPRAMREVAAGAAHWLRLHAASMEELLRPAPAQAAPEAQSPSTEQQAAS